MAQDFCYLVKCIVWRSRVPCLFTARTKAKLCFAGSRPSIKKDPFGSLIIWDGRTVLFAGIKRDYDFSFRNFISSRKSLHPLPAPARTKAKLCFAGSRPSIKKDPFGSLIIWDGRTRTSECLDQNQVPYHLATSHCCHTIILHHKY